MVNSCHGSEPAMRQHMNEFELGDGACRQDEGIEIGLVHGMVETVDREGNGKQGVDQLRHALGVMRIEIDPRRPSAGDNRQVGSASRFQRIDDVEIVRSQCSQRTFSKYRSWPQARQANNSIVNPAKPNVTLLAGTMAGAISQPAPTGPRRPRDHKLEAARRRRVS